MKQLVMIPLCLFPVVLSAQPENVDSARTDTLREVVVEAELQHVTAKVVTYTPTKRVKKSAQDAVDLLQQMSIHELQKELHGDPWSSWFILLQNRPSMQYRSLLRFPCPPCRQQTVRRSYSHAPANT